MIKQIMIAQCDICGKTVPVKPSGPSYDQFYDVPDGWIKSETNSDFCICDKCAEKLKGELHQ